MLHSEAKIHCRMHQNSFLSSEIEKTAPNWSKTSRVCRKINFPSIDRKSNFYTCQICQKMAKIGYFEHSLFFWRARRGGRNFDRTMKKNFFDHNIDKVYLGLRIMNLSYVVPKIFRFLSPPQKTRFFWGGTP